MGNNIVNMRRRKKSYKKLENKEINKMIVKNCDFIGATRLPLGVQIIRGSTKRK